MAAPMSSEGMELEHIVIHIKYRNTYLCGKSVSLHPYILSSFFFFFRKILKKRTNLEYKLRRRTKCKEDFMRYVQVNININRAFVVLEG